MPGYLTTKQAADLLKVAEATIHDWARRGLLHRYRRGTERVWSTDELDRACDAPKPRRQA